MNTIIFEQTIRVEGEPQVRPSEFVRAQRTPETDAKAKKFYEDLATLRYHEAIKCKNGAGRSQPCEICREIIKEHESLRPNGPS